MPSLSPPGRGRSRYAACVRLVRAGVAAALVALAALAFALPAAAQSSTTFVSNTAQPAYGTSATQLPRAQRFTTGSHANGYDLSGVRLNVGPGYAFLSLSLCTVDTNGYPRVLDGERSSGIAMHVKSDAMWVRTKSARSDELAGTKGDVTRLRLRLEGERAFELASDGRFTASADVGLRHDGGDAETGAGLEVGAGARYARGALSIEGQVRTLLVHEASGYREWGASGAIRVTPGPGARGLRLQIRPEWGRTESAAERLWSARDAGGLEGSGEFEAERRLVTDLGYAFSLSEARGLLTPYAGVTLGEAGRRTVRSGVRWTLGADLEAGLEAARARGTAGDEAGEVRLHAAFRF